MSEEAVEAARSAMKKAFAETVGVLEAGSKRVTDLQTSVAAWLATTFVALNAAVIPLILSYVEKTAFPRVALILASCGLVSALVSACVMCFHLGEVRDANQAVIESIQSVDVDGDLTKMDKIDTSPTDRIVTRARRVVVPMLVSLAFFGASVATFGVGFKFEDVSNTRRCAAVQNDMLAARPRRLDSHDLFQALGCHPQGGGSVYAPPENRERQAT